LSPRQRTAGVLVEDVKVIVRERHPHVIADRGTSLRRQEDANLDACVLEIDQSVIAKEFNQVDIATDDVKGVRSTRGAEVRGPDAGDNRLRAIKVSKRSRSMKSAGALRPAALSSLPFTSTSKKFIAGVPMKAATN
jgi:hypothetical protein